MRDYIPLRAIIMIPAVIAIVMFLVMTGETGHFVPGVTQAFFGIACVITLLIAYVYLWHVCDDLKDELQDLKEKYGIDDDDE